MSNAPGGGRRDAQSRLSAVAEHPRATAASGASVAGSVVAGDVHQGDSSRLLSLSDLQKPESSVLSGRKTGSVSLSRKNSNSSFGNQNPKIGSSRCMNNLHEKPKL